MQKQLLGDPEFAIALPANDETLGLQFNVFGSCSSLPAGTPIVVVVKNDGNEVCRADAVINDRARTFEAAFQLPDGTNIVENKGSVVAAATVDGRETTASSVRLNIYGESALTIANPASGGTFPDWGAGVVTASGNVVACVGMVMWLRLTDGGNDIIGHQEWPITSDNMPWSLDLGPLVTANSDTTRTGHSFCIHVSVWDYRKNTTGVQQVRISSGFFSVGTG